MDSCSNILTLDEALTALDINADYFANQTELNDLIAEASFYVYRRTLHDWGADNPIQPLAKSCAKLCLKQSFFADSAHDYQKSIDLLIADLNDMVQSTQSEGDGDE